jgi:hypothetical protein
VDERIVDYDPIAHLNLLFSHPSTVSSRARVSSTLQRHNDDLTQSIAALETAQAYGPDSSLERMQSAQAELASLFQRIESVRSRALQTERDITTMTADIKRLDGTKRNLTHSMTALKRLQMLTTAYEQLRGLARTRQYRECAGLLQAVLQLMRHFNSYRSIEQIAVLSRNVNDLQRELLEQVCEDFEIAFAKGEVTARRGVLVEACLVMDALGEHAKSRILTWYVNTELREYRQVFRGNDEAGSLDNIGRRYAWFKRTLKTHEEEHAAIFPPHWRAGEALAAAFCDGTRDDFKGILEKSMRRTDGNKIDVNLLLSCLQETMNFEQSLERRFASEPRASIDTLSSADDRQQSFNGLISVAFEPYLSLWVESQDRTLAGMIPRYRSQPLLPPDEEFSSQAVIPSAIELFHFYKLTLSQCAKLSTGERLLDLTKTLAKYLDEYAQQVLLTFLQRTNHGPTVQDIILVLNTADFWHTNTNQLEENIKKRIDSDLASKVDLSSQSDAFMGVASASVLAMVNKVEVDCEGAWREMKNTNWRGMEAVGGQSSYVGELLRSVNAGAAEVLPLIVKPQYARAFCDNLIEHLATAYIHNIVQCRPVSEVGAEQVCFSHPTMAGQSVLTHLDVARQIRPHQGIWKSPVLPHSRSAIGHPFHPHPSPSPPCRLRQARQPEHDAHRPAPQDAPSPPVAARRARASLPHPHWRPLRHQLPQDPRAQGRAEARPGAPRGALHHAPRQHQRGPAAGAELAAAHAAHGDVGAGEHGARREPGGGGRGRPAGAVRRGVAGREAPERGPGRGGADECGGRGGRRVGRHGAGDNGRLGERGGDGGGAGRGEGDY